mgnify:CR=1 FL=1
MKKLILVSIIFLSVFACKKTAFSPEGPTDIRIRNLTGQTLTEVIVSTSEYSEDIDTLGNINKGEVSEYFRFKKAYPNVEISAKINIGGSMVTYSTGTVNYDYLQYIGQDRITYEVKISDMNTRELKITNRIIEEPLVLK